MANIQNIIHTPETPWNFEPVTFTVSLPHEPTNELFVPDGSALMFTGALFTFRLDVEDGFEAATLLFEGVRYPMTKTGDAFTVTFDAPAHGEYRAELEVLRKDGTVEQITAEQFPGLLLTVKRTEVPAALSVDHTPKPALSPGGRVTFEAELAAMPGEDAKLFIPAGSAMMFTDTQLFGSPRVGIASVELWVDGKRYPMSKDAETPLYTADLPSPKSSYWQPDGYYNCLLRVVMEDGVFDEYDGADFPGLRLVVRDTAPPEINPVSPAGQYLTDLAPGLVFAITDDDPGVDPNSVLLSVDGASVAVTYDETTGRATYAGALADGLHTAAITATDYDGNFAERSVSFTVDTAPPVLTISSPTNGDLIEIKTVTISGTATDETSGIARVTVGGVEVPVTGGQFSRTLTLPDRQYTYEVAATDRAGHVTRQSVTFTMDGDPPALTVTDPADGGCFTSAPITVSGRASDNGSGVASLAINGTLVALTDGAFTYQLPAGEGEVEIRIVATDHSGNSTEVIRTVLVDFSPPEILLYSRRVVVDTPTVEVVGYAYDTGGRVTVEANGAVAAPGGDGIFRLAVPLEVGENAVTVTARDTAGKGVSAELYFIRLITDRTQADVDELLELLSKPTWTAAERAWFNAANSRGAYNTSDLNRVTVAMKYLQGRMVALGFNDPYNPVLLRHANGATSEIWYEADERDLSKVEDYRDNAERVSSALPLPATAPAMPPTMRIDYEDANAIERRLVLADEVRVRAEDSVFYCDEILTGEV